LLLVAGKDVILVVCNRLSKIMHFVVITEEILVDELPESIMLDRGPQFAAEMTKELNKILRIKTKLSTAFYP